METDWKLTTQERILGSLRIQRDLAYYRLGEIRIWPNYYLIIIYLLFNYLIIYFIIIHTSCTSRLQAFWCNVELF